MNGSKVYHHDIVWWVLDSAMDFMHACMGSEVFVVNVGLCHGLLHCIPIRIFTQKKYGRPVNRYVRFVIAVTYFYHTEPPAIL